MFSSKKIQRFSSKQIHNPGHNLKGSAATDNLKGWAVKKVQRFSSNKYVNEESQRFSLQNHQKYQKNVETFYNVFKKKISSFLPSKSWKKLPQKFPRITQIHFFSLLPAQPKHSKQKNSCSKMWPIDQLYIDTQLRHKSKKSKNLGRCGR